MRHERALHHRNQAKAYSLQESEDDSEKVKELKKITREAHLKVSKELEKLEKLDGVRNNFTGICFITFETIAQCDIVIEGYSNLSFGNFFINGLYAKGNCCSSSRKMNEF